jgi:hypothetical protein
LDGDGICPGACNGTYRRRRAMYEAAVAEHARILETRTGADPIPEPPKAPDTEPWLGLPVWCAKCQGILRAELLDLDDLAALIAVIPPLAKPAETGAGRVSGSRERPSSSPRMDDLEELGEWLRQWEAIARSEDDPRPRRGYLATERTTVTAWLTEHFDGLITNPDVAQDFGEEIRRWHRDMATRATAGRMSRHMKKACPRCRLYTLWLMIGDDYIRCVNEDCNRAMTRQEFDDITDAA